MTVFFNLGEVIFPPEFADLAGSDLLIELLYRHSHGDWGDVSDEDYAENDQTLICQLPRPLASKYRISGGREVSVVTDMDRIMTTMTDSLKDSC